MCSLEWFWDLLPHLSEAEAKVIGAIRRSGWEERDNAGDPCITLRASLRELAADAGTARNSAFIAAHSLSAIGVLAIHPSGAPHGATVYQLKRIIPRRLQNGIKNRSPNFRPLNRIRSPKLGLPLTTPGVVDDNLLSGIGSEVISSSTPPPGESSSPNFGLLIRKLVSFGFVNAESFVATHTPERVEAALDYVEDPGAPEFHSPVGFLRHMVESRGDIPLPPSKVQNGEAPRKSRSCPHSPGGGLQCMASKTPAECITPEDCPTMARMNSRQPHELEIVGSTPTPATIPSPFKGDPLQ